MFTDSTSLYASDAPIVQGIAEVLVNSVNQFKAPYQWLIVHKNVTLASQNPPGMKLNG